jgi:hypothetical protein
VNRGGRGLRVSTGRSFFPMSWRPVASRPLLITPFLPMFQVVFLVCEDWHDPDGIANGWIEFSMTLPTCLVSSIYSALLHDLRSRASPEGSANLDGYCDSLALRPGLLTGCPIQPKLTSL